MSAPIVLRPEPWPAQTGVAWPTPAGEPTAEYAALREEWQRAAETLDVAVPDPRGELYRWECETFQALTDYVEAHGLNYTVLDPRGGETGTAQAFADSAAARTPEDQRLTLSIGDVVAHLNYTAGRDVCSDEQTADAYLATLSAGAVDQLIEQAVQEYATPR